MQRTPTAAARLGPSWRGQPVHEELVERLLPMSPGSPRAARELTGAACRSWRIGPVCDAALLAVSELVGNAVRHGSPGDLRLRLSMTARRLRLEVCDSASTQPALRRVADGDEGGRGLHLVAAVSARWGVRREAVGKTVWAEIALPADGHASPSLGESERTVQQ